MYTIILREFRLKAAENNLKSVKWESKFIPRIPLRDDEINKINIDNVDEFAEADHPYFAKESVVFDLVSKRFIVEENACSQLFGGRAIYGSSLASVGAYSYDGQYCYAWERSSLGEEEPNADEHTDARLSVDAKKVEKVSRFLETNGASVDFGIGFPGYLAYSGVDGVFAARALSSTLSDWNKEGFPISINETPDGKWAIEAKVIETRSGYNDAPLKLERVIRMHVLPEEGVIVYFSSVAQVEDKEIEQVRIEADVARDEKQSVVLRKMYVMRPLGRMMDYITFPSYEINPPVEKEMFSLVFPEGTYVDDYVEKMYYRAGDVVNKDQATSEFMTRHRLTGVDSAKRDVFVIRLVLIGLGTAMILFALWRAVRRRRRTE